MGLSNQSKVEKQPAILEPVPAESVTALMDILW